MLDTSRWPIEMLDVLRAVHLDPKNVRLETADAKVEADIIEDLFVNEDALGLVEGICKIGYLTHETPVVLKRQGKYVMVEGNRRLAALKAIQNPMLVPDFQARISAHASSLPDRSTLAKVRVMVAPNQTEADQLIAAIHTGNLRKPWSPSRQAAFFQAQIDSGRDLGELLDRYPTIDVRKFVFRAHIMNLFKSVKYDDAELQDFLATKKWSRGLSTLARIYESKDFLAITGVAMNANGDVSKKISNTVFKDIATEIVRGMYEENINTRSLNSVSSPRYTQLMKELRQIVEDANEADPSVSGDPVPGPRGDISPTEASPEGAPVETGASSAEPPRSAQPIDAVSTSKSRAPAKRPAPKKKPRNLDLGQIKAPEGYPEALKSLLGEMSVVDVQKFPNGTFLMTRAVLEKSIKAFAEAKTIDIKSTGNNQNGKVQLGHALNWLLDHVKSNGPTYLIQVIEGVRTGKLVEYVNSSDSLNAINHNHHFMVDSDQAFSMWASIDSVMRYLMKP
ncbi:hypothetical protein SAMN04489751_1615 [Brevibacterium sandarakinum]|uniref:ParB-like nuclease domain-containing protein n=1 Tax=Brevibacterium sandarakinum TaxID=629680 RepID=A0A1H1QSM6_BRESA|nr:hypothetical protein [Brevibacterium sandarakinum]SDS26347.1 hypothetical protein SAMN04489751_1615 [Brevibacterium sandarakinum]